MYYAERIYQINLAIAGIAIGTVSLPILSKAIAAKSIKKIHNIQNRSIELSLLSSLPASLGLILASEEIVNALFGYGSFTQEDIRMTASALKYFGYGIPAFAFIKIFSNFFFARSNTVLPFYVSLIVVLLNLAISLSLFPTVGFVIIPISTSISTWIGVIFYAFLLQKYKTINFEVKLFNNFFKILSSSMLMALVLMYSLDYFTVNLDYSNKYKSIYLMFIVSFMATIYLISCYLFGVLKTKNYKVN